MKTSYTTNIGDRLSINCLAQGHPLPEIDWYRNEEILRSDHEFSIDKSTGELVIRSISDKHSGLYTCHARNEAGKAMQDILVYVTGVGLSISYNQ